MNNPFLRITYPSQRVPRAATEHDRLLDTAAQAWAKLKTALGELESCDEDDPPSSELLRDMDIAAFAILWIMWDLVYAEPEVLPGLKDKCRLLLEVRNQRIVHRPKGSNVSLSYSANGGPSFRKAGRNQLVDGLVQRVEVEDKKGHVVDDEVIRLTDVVEEFVTQFEACSPAT